MEKQMMEYSLRWLQWLSRLLCLTAAMLCFVLSVRAQTDAILPTIGGSGGGFFVAHCPESQFLTGFELRAGDDIDAIRPLCVTAYGPRETSPVSFTKGSGLITIAKSPFGKQFDLVELESGWYGGTGGNLTNVISPSDQPIVIGIYVYAEGLHTVTVNTIHLFCGLASAQQTSTEWPAAKIEPPLCCQDEEFRCVERGTQRCPTGLVALGVNGRSGKWLDSMGLICGAPKLTPKAPEPVKAVGRTRGSLATGPPLSICEAAREARARNSPAAPGLEAQCRAAGPAGETPPVKAVGRTKVPGAATDVPPRPICDVAREAQARNSPAAPGLGESWRAELAAKGAAIAQVDEIVAEARVAET